MKFNIGDKVRVVRCRAHVNCKYNNTMGKIIGIVANRLYLYELKGFDELFREDELELVQEKQFTKADLKDGDIVTYRNGIRRLVNATNKKIVFIQNPNILSFDFCDFRADLTNKNKEGKEYDIVKIERPVKYETVFEREEEILDEAEKKYLANVIRPFKDKIKGIVKISNFDNEYILIEVKDDGNIVFPYFKKGTMYKRMRPKKEYTLEELKL